MAGGFELGVLLGEYGGGQSFEHVSSWSKLLDQCSVSFGVTTNVHSSPSGLRVEVYSHGFTTDGLFYDYDVPGDAQSRWSPAVNTHNIVSYVWARIDTAAHSGDTIFTLGTAVGETVAYIPHADTLQRTRLTNNVTSGDSLTRADFEFTLSQNSYSFYADDLLVAADVITLHPDRDVTRAPQQIRSDAYGLGGTVLSYRWGEEHRFTLQVRYMPSSEKDLINRWWANGFPLLFTFDGSDTSQTFVTVLEGIGAPFTHLMRPYPDLWEGTLRLRALTGGLVF